MLTIFMTSLLIMMMIPPVLLLLNLILSKKSNKSLEKSSPFECGFDPLSFNRLPFSIQFFLITMIFLIFDIEITLLIPVILLMYLFNIQVITLSSIFVTILILGLYFEYVDKSIEWQK